MKTPTTLLFLFAGVLAFTMPVGAAESPVPANQPILVNPPEPKPQLTVFDLDFPGGTPRELVAAIEKAQRRPLNAIVPNEYAQWKLSPLKMSHVTVAELFGALEQMIVTTEYPTGNGGATIAQVTASFRTTDRRPTDDSIWYFRFTGTPVRDTPVTRYYRLAPYLDSGLTVDDITTAIQTGWKMSGLTNVPKLSFHKETRLLIAVGDQNAVATIDNVLGTLDPSPKSKEPTAAEKPEKKS